MRGREEERWDRRFRRSTQLRPHNSGRRLPRLAAPGGDSRRVPSRVRLMVERLEVWLIRAVAQPG